MRSSVLAVFLALLAHSVAYNPMPLPPSRGRYQVGYDPDNRGRPASVPPLRKNVLHDRREGRRWQPPEGYAPQRRRLRLRAPAQSSNPPETIDWANPEDPHTQQETTLCSGIWMGNTILHKTCVTLSLDDIPDLP